jgi:K+-sensing histidine kinase KdpD
MNRTMLSRQSHPNTFLLLDTLIGALLCALTACIVALAAHKIPARTLVPLFFIAVIVLVALRFGALAGALGAFCATVIFAYFLFTPVGSFKVLKGDARTNLVWMLLIGIPAGYFAWATRTNGASSTSRHFPDEDE